MYEVKEPKRGALPTLCALGGFASMVTGLYMMLGLGPVLMIGGLFVFLSSVAVLTGRDRKVREYYARQERRAGQGTN